MKKQFRMKTLVISLAITGMLLSPLFMTAQTERQGLFDKNGKLGGSRTSDGITWNGMTTQNPTEAAPTPLGSGVLVLFAAGVSYALLKKKEDAE